MKLTKGMPCNPEGMEFCEICNMSFVRKEAYYKHANDQHRVRDLSGVILVSL